MTKKEAKSLISRAKAFATKMHKGQRRKTGETFITHPERVAMLVSHYNDATPEMIAAAWCHDVLEDCPGVTYTMLSSALDNERAAKLVIILSKKEGETYFDFIMRIAEDDEARIIKIADITHNKSTWKEEGSLKDKWRLAMYILLSRSWANVLHDDWMRGRRKAHASIVATINGEAHATV